MASEEVIVGNWADWERVIAKIIALPKKGEGILAKSMMVAADRMRDEAQHFLDVMVYSAPLPASAAGREAWYEANRRTGRTRDAIKSRRVSPTVAEAYVDRDDYPAYFYALSLEFGLHRWPRYYPRPFWRSAAAIMELKFVEIADEAAMQFRVAIEL